jgi:hypothetical protein
MTGTARPSLGATLFAGLALPVLAASPSSFSSPVEPHDLLRTLGFSSSEIQSVDQGQSLAKVLDTDRRQIAVVGAVRIHAQRERLLMRYRNVEYLKGSELVVSVGAFSNPPRAEDLKALAFEDYDLDLRECRPGECRVRLSAEDIARFHRNVNWNSAEWRAKSAEVWRDLLAAYAASFRTRGLSALPVYANKSESLGVRDELQVLLGESTFVASLAPEFQVYLKEPAGSPSGTIEKLLYWSKEDFGVRPVMRVTQQAVHTPSVDNRAAPVLISTMQVYANHYLDAALGLTLALEPTGAAPDAGFYLIAVNRARTRSLTGFMRVMVRSAVQNRTRDAMLKILKSTKSGLEAAQPR